MSYKKLGSWFISENGRKCAFGVAAATALSTFCVQYAPHTFLIDKYKDIVHYYRHGIAVPLHPELVNRFKKAVDLAQVSEHTKKFYSAFSAVGFDIFCAGSSYSKYGCVVGLPINFTYNNIDTIDKSSIKIMSESVVWESKEAKEFLHSLVLSEKAQLYAMAREIRMLDTMKLYIDSISSTFAVCFTYIMSQFVNNKFNLYVKPVGVRLTLYGLVATFWYTNYCFVTDFTQLKYERQVDEELKHLNPIFVEGAIEFYGKILQRNKALRHLMGKDGESTYSVLGNEIYLLRQRHLPLVQRKSYFENKLDPKESVFKEYM